METRKADASALPLPTPDTYNFHKAQIVGFAEKKETANANYRNALKSAQKAGIDTDALLQARKDKRADDPVKVRRHLEQYAFALAQEGFPVVLTVHDVTYGTSVEAAAAKAKHDFEAGKFADNPYPDGSEESKAYSDKFSALTAERLGVSEEDGESSHNDDAEEHDESEPEEWPDDAQVRGAEQREPALTH